jgi:hypothetical protein
MATEQERDRALKLLNMALNAKNEVEAEAALAAMEKKMREDNLAARTKRVMAGGIVDREEDKDQAEQDLLDQVAIDADELATESRQFKAKQEEDAANGFKYDLDFRTELVLLILDKMDEGSRDEALKLLVHMRRQARTEAYFVQERLLGISTLFGKIKSINDLDALKHILEREIHSAAADVVYLYKNDGSAHLAQFQPRLNKAV